MNWNARWSNAIRARERILLRNFLRRCFSNNADAGANQQTFAVLEHDTALAGHVRNVAKAAIRSIVVTKL